MELALATNKPPTRNAPAAAGSQFSASERRYGVLVTVLPAAARQLLLVMLLGIVIAYIVPACLNFASRPVDEEPRSSALLHGSGLDLQAALVCESAPVRVWQHSACDLPK